MHSFHLLSFASLALAAWDTNLNFNSPSRRSGHEYLGIDVPKVIKRTTGDGLRKRQTSPWAPEDLKFTHGVASGDPYPDSVILWTRASPEVKNDASNVTVEGYVELYSHETEKYIAASAEKVCVEWSISPNEDLSGVVDGGKVFTTSDIDFTVKIEAKNLQPFTQYYYQFGICGSDIKSPLGRTKTSPAEESDVDAVKFAVYSCSQYQNGYFNAYGNAARKDNVDFVIHLGDYIYESTKGNLSVDPRATNPAREIVTLYDYRTRIAQYRSDEDLALSHQQFAWIPTWDDHEVANNGYRDGFSNMNNTEQSFVKYKGVSTDQRKMNAVRAYFEWMPIRQVDMDDNLRIWRSFKMGKLLDLIILDTRNYDRSITTLGWNDDYVPQLAQDASRSLMGPRQEKWFYHSLSESADRGAAWRIIGNQIVFSTINSTSRSGNFEEPYNSDQWDGYMANRNRTLSHLYENKIGNNIFLAGDSHANWVSDLAWLEHPETGLYDPATGANSIGAEFGGTAVTSSGYGSAIASSNNQSDYLIRDNPELKWSEGYFRGYFELAISMEKVEARFFGIPTVAERVPYEVPLANFTVVNGENKLQRPIGGGVAYSGALADGEVKLNNITYNTETGGWEDIGFDRMFIKY